MTTLVSSSHHLTLRPGLSHFNYLHMTAFFKAQWGDFTLFYLKLFSGKKQLNLTFQSKFIESMDSFICWIDWKDEIKLPWIHLNGIVDIWNRFPKTKNWVGEFIKYKLSENDPGSNTSSCVIIKAICVRNEGAQLEYWTFFI